MNFNLEIKFYYNKIPSDPVAKIFDFNGHNFKSTTGDVCPLIKGTSEVNLANLCGSITATAPPPLVSQETYFC